MKSLLIARQLLRAKRWLWLLLVLWPWAMAVALRMTGGGAMAQQDIVALAEQECLYGLALVAFTGGALLGNEQRSRRIVVVLARAVRRGEYLFALWLTTVLPLLLYAGSVGLSGLLLGGSTEMLGRLMIAVTLIGIPLAGLVLLASIWLPGVLAAALGLLLTAGLLLPTSQSALAAQLRLLVQGAGERQAVRAMVESVCLAAVFFAAAVTVFCRRDLDLKGE